MCVNNKHFLKIAYLMFTYRCAIEDSYKYRKGYGKLVHYLSLVKIVLIVYIRCKQRHFRMKSF